MLNRTGSALLGRNAWRSFLALGLALTGVYLLLPRGGLAGGIVYVSLGVAMTAAIAVGIAIYRPSPRLPWLLLLAGTALYTTLGNGIWYLLPVGFGKTLPFQSVADAV